MRIAYRAAALSCISLLGTVFALAPAWSSTLAYQNAGTENQTKYSFKANGGDITATYLGSGAAYDEKLGLLVNGVAVSPLVFQDHQTAVGTTFNFGSFAKGSVITFYITVQQNEQTFYSDAARNNDGANHIYSTGIPATSTSPAATYVGFEDLSANRSLTPHQDWDVDYNYTDEQFSFTNLDVTTTSPDATVISSSSDVLPSPVPLPATAPLFGVAVLALGLAGSRVKRKTADVAP